MAFVRIKEPRVGSYNQKMQNKVKIHIYPSGKEVIEAFISTDFEVFDRNGWRIRTFNEFALNGVHPMKVTARIQDKCHNG